MDFTEEYKVLITVMHREKGNVLSGRLWVKS